MTPEELLEEWTGGESSGMRPQRVQDVRDELMEYTGLTFPRRISELEAYTERMKGQITRKLKDAAEEAESADSGDEE